MHIFIVSSAFVTASTAMEMKFEGAKKYMVEKAKKKLLELVQDLSLRKYKHQLKRCLRWKN